MTQPAAITSPYDWNLLSANLRAIYQQVDDLYLRITTSAEQDPEEKEDPVPNAEPTTADQPAAHEPERPHREDLDPVEIEPDDRFADYDLELDDPDEPEDPTLDLEQQ